MSWEELRLPCDQHFLDHCARHLLGCGDGQDLSGIEVVLPGLQLAEPLRAALARHSGAALLLPAMDTLPARLAPWLAGIDHLPDSRRRLAIFEALRSRRWFDDASLWGVAAELVDLFDELTLHGVELPSAPEDLEALLVRAYHCRGDAPLRFEARLAVELWHAERIGTRSRSAAQLLAAARWAGARELPLTVIAEGEPSAFERRVYAACAERVPVTLLIPDRGIPSAWPLLDQAWPEDPASPPLQQRLAAAPRIEGMDRQVGIIASESLEALAGTVVALVADWLRAGRRRIALVAVDRGAARRARALLEREGILVADETGWKLSTTRAAALLDAMLRVVDGEAYHRDLADLFKSPFVLSDLGAEERAGRTLELQQALARGNVISGWEAVASVLAGNPIGERLRRLREALPLSPASPAGWLARLAAALEALSARPALAADAAGAQVLEWLQQSAVELAGETLTLSFPEWRQWLDAALESAMFRDRSIDSPVVMTHLAATRLRSFEAAIVIGADAVRLAPADRHPVFAHAQVREELGLPGNEAARARLHADLASLIAHGGECVFLWQSVAGGEPQLLAPALELLELAHRCACGTSLHRAAPASAEPEPGPGLPAAAPVLPAELLPQRISASGFASLLKCPYQYFAGRVLGLVESDEVGEEMEKRDYGELIHRVLADLHRLHPVFLDAPPERLLASLERISGEHFGPAVDRNFMELGWLARWRKGFADYIEWQRAREREGWRFAGGEVARRRGLVLADRREVHLEGRLDRIDRGPGGACAVIDYKARDPSALRRLVKDPDDVQLALYAALADGEAVEALYLAVDGRELAGVALEAVGEQTGRQLRRLHAALEAIAAGAPLAANAADCSHCPMSGLCRREYRP